MSGRRVPIRRVALVASSYAPHLGGVEEHVRQAARELSLRPDTEVEVWTVDRGEHLGVRTVEDVQTVEQALVENLHRQDLGPLEEAAAYQQLIDDFGLTHEDVAARVGRSRATVSNMLRLFHLPPSIQRLVSDGRLTAGSGLGARRDTSRGCGWRTVRR